MNSNELLEFLLTRVQLFNGFPKDKLKQLIAGSKIGTFEPHEAVVKLGEENHNFFILIDGSAEISVTSDRGEKIQLATLSPGEFFGEISMMTGERSIADIIGITHCTALFIPDEIFTSLITSYTPALRFLTRSINIKSANWASKIPGNNLAEFAERNSADPYGFKLQSDNPIKILVFNCGSSSLKYQLFDTATDIVAAKGLIENIGLSNGKHKYSVFDVKYEHPSAAKDFAEAIADMINVLTDEQHRCFNSPEEICSIGHRVVHGGDKFTGSVVITDEVIAGIEASANLAPLHNPVNLQGIRAAKAIFPHAHHVAVFDTAFHHTIPNYAYLYALPYELYEKKHIRKYGFHGTSHSYVSLRAAQYLKSPVNSLKLISCHLGNGTSMCAIDHGRSIDTTMGLTPTAGLIMGTRCGDVDPGILTHLMRFEGYSVEDCERMINRQSGLLGISGLSSDMREITSAAHEGNQRAQITVKCFGYRVRKYIGAYVAAMQGLDAIIFTGGIGQGSVDIRSHCCQGLECMGIFIDEVKNNAVDLSNGPCDISADNSHVKILVIATDEERMIARETLRAVRKERTAKTAPVRRVPVEVSAHHLHLSSADIETLFGKGHTLTWLADLSQPGQFACKEQVTLVGPKGTIERVRVLGPARKETQIEIALTEQFKLGVNPPVRESGDIVNTPGITLKGTVGEVKLEKGVICAKRHIHMTPADALNFGLHDKETVCVKVESDRGLIFDNVVVRVNQNFKLAMHIDTDEANAAGVSAKTEMTGIIL
jgi:acetate kinase